MKRLEIFGIAIVIIGLAGTIVGSFAWENFLESQRECITIHMRTFENGNPTPNVIHLKKNVPACLRLTSDDTTHGFNIPDFNITADPIHPGKWTYLRFTPKESGTFSFVCNIVCSAGHSRVRGQIIVDD
ncbi:MAG: cupredoxin domain-containing protein [Chloroflexota bacterium]